MTPPTGPSGPEPLPAPGTPATPTPQPPRLLPLPLRWLLMAFAVASLCMGIIGIFVPGLPTTVFVLLAAWAAARSSPRMHHWLLAHRLFGPTIRNWHNGGRMSRRAKWSATVMMGLCIAVLFFTTSREWLAEALTVFMLLILLWLWRRPEPPEGRLP